MSAYEPQHTIHRIEGDQEVHYRIAGLYTADGIGEFLADLALAAGPSKRAALNWLNS